MSITVSVIAVGTELLSGEMSDTNTADIARSLADRGIGINDALVVADVESDIAEALHSRAGRRDAVIVTGGLGPTRDDLTARAAGHAFGRQLTLNDEALQQIRDFFRQRGRAMNRINEKQALLPQKAAVLRNPEGSAPGFHLGHRETDFFFLPGVPAEMNRMLSETIIPRLQQRAGRLSPRREKIFKVFGLPEARVGEMLDGARLPEGVELAYGLDFPLVLVKLRARGEDAEDLLDRAELEIRRALGEYLVAIGSNSLADTVVSLLSSADATLSVAESCTGGLIAEMLTDVAGASEVFDRAAVTYSNRAKQNWLGVAEVTLNRHGAVSAECALSMAS
ncbi:MAG: CinA family nicotinamide mononucleotide deamidase-related protein, partial [Desulfuromonadales bacterium]